MTTRLYSIETNQGFPLQAPELPHHELRNAADAFGITIRGVRQVAKRNDSSQLFRIESPENFVGLRAAPSQKARATEAQCRIARLVTRESLLSPLKTLDGGYVALTGSRAWTAYTWLEGEIFDGKNQPFMRVLATALSLQKELRELDGSITEANREIVPVMRHRGYRWGPIFETLTGGGEDADILDPLDEFTRDLLSEHRSAVRRTVDELSVLDLDEPRLTHNDINHSNVLVTEADVHFLDLEDICIESRGVAIGHAAFKLARHAVFTGATQPADTRSQLTEELPPLLDEMELGSMGSLLAHAAYRIVSDIFEICDYTKEHDRSQVYDLEKRIHNLFELFDLWGVPLGTRLT